MSALALFLALAIHPVPYHGYSPLGTPAQVPAQGPCTSPDYRQFDFWLGEWEVSNPEGVVVGRSRIESILGGCVVAEHWSSARGGLHDGKSYNQYNASLGKWEQFWVDASGSRLVLSGTFADGAMVLEGRREPDANGVSVRERITWTTNADGSVRQLWQTSSDEGKTWGLAFDGTYRRRATP